jgi:hypothetical protein
MLRWWLQTEQGSTFTRCTYIASSDLNLLGNGQSVIDLDPKVSDGTLDPAMI